MEIINKPEFNIRICEKCKTKFEIKTFDLQRLVDSIFVECPMCESRVYLPDYIETVLKKIEE